MIDYKRYLPFSSVVLVSILAWAISVRMSIVLSYNDAMSHLDIARLVVDNQQYGIAQLGTVWLPLNHLLMLPFVWNNWSWHSGFAGSIVSMAAFVTSVTGAYLLAKELTESKWAPYVSAAVIGLNVNLLYLQATPLSEPVYIAVFILSVLFLVRYLKTRSSPHLVLAAIFAALQIIARYDGWFVVATETVVLAAYSLLPFSRTKLKQLGIVIAFVFPSIVAVALWLLWNLLLFGNPLYSFLGPNSAHAQASAQAVAQPITSGNILLSLKAYYLASSANIGLAIIALGLLGWVMYAMTHKQSRTIVITASVALGSAIVFNIIALLIGFAVINLPGMNWNPSHTPAGALFNVRYGIIALPFFAIGVGLLVSVKRYVKVLVPLTVAIVVLQGASLLINVPITVQDGTHGLSAFTYQDTAQELKQVNTTHAPVVMSFAKYSDIAFSSGLPLKSFIHEGDSKEWSDAKAHPEKYARYIVMSNSSDGDPVYDTLVTSQKSAFTKSYTLVVHGYHASIYELRSDQN